MRTDYTSRLAGAKMRDPLHGKAKSFNILLFKRRSRQKL